jgi:hypothetical protein
MTGSELIEKVQQRVGDDPDLAPSLQHYRPQEVLSAINMAQRLFVLQTLVLEATSTFEVTEDSAFYRMLTFFPDWIAPLRIRTTAERKLAPTKFAGLAALDGSWTEKVGPITRYASGGFDLLGVYGRADAILRVTYARSPIQLFESASPEIPEESHAALIEGAIPLCRVREGQQEWQKTLPYWGKYVEEVGRVADYVRARNRELGFDRFPPEVRRFDMSQFVKKGKKQWPTT